LAVALQVLLYAAPALAQTSTVTGRAVDAQGGAVGGAEVILLNTTSQRVGSSRSGSDGAFSIGNVPPGPYVLRIEAPGFQSWTQNVIVVTGASQPVNAVLQIAAIAEEVAVSAPKLEEELPQDIERTGVRMQTISGSTIEAAGYDDVGQALQSLVPTMFLTPRSGAFDYVVASLQGSRTPEILWLVDGVRISNRLYNGTTPLDTIPAHMIERIEVIEGGQGLFYGTQAVAGVINVVTRAFSDTTRGRLQTGVDSNGGRHINVFTGDTRGRNRFVFYGSSDIADGYQSFPENEYSASTTDRLRSYNVLTFGAKYAYDFSDAVRVSTMYQRTDGNLDFLSRPARSSATQSGGLAGAYNERDEHIFSAKLDVTPREQFQFFVKTYYHRWDTYYNETRNLLADPGSQVVISADEFWGYKDFGVNFLAKLAPRRGVEYFAGYDLQNYGGRDDVLLIADTNETVNALFGQVRTTRDLWEKTTLAAGLRFNAPTNSQSSTVWNLSGQYDFAANLFARGTLGTSFRYPDAYQLFAIDDTCCLGNPDLKPEQSFNINGSFGARLINGTRTFNVEIVGFYRNVEDLIVATFDENDLEIPQNSQDAVKVKGVSLIGSTALSGDFSASLGYTFAQTKRVAGAQGSDSAIAGLPENHFQLMLDYHPARLPFGVLLTANTVGEMFDSVATFGNVPSGDYTIVDLAGRVFLDAGRRHRINMRLENLFDNEYTTLHGRGFNDAGNPFLMHFLGPERTFHVTYGFSF
jgi:vitamin B12 transporter